VYSMMKRFLASVVIGASLLLCNSSASAQESPCLRRTVLVNAVTEAGLPVQGLSASDFSAEFRGKPIRILSTTRHTVPPRIVIVLDASGSMTSRPADWEIARQIAVDAVRKTPAASLVALIVFSSQVVLKIDFSKGRMTVLEQLMTVQPGKSILTKGRKMTALWDAIHEAIQLLEPARAGDVIYIITDGGDNASRMRREEIEHRLIASGVRPFIAGPLHLAGFRTPEEHYAPREIGAFTEATGGASLFIGLPTWPRIDEKHVSAFSEQTSVVYTSLISNFYALEIYLPFEGQASRLEA